MSPSARRVSLRAYLSVAAACPESPVRTAGTSEREEVGVDEITRTVLEDVSRWKREGVLPTVRPCCGQRYCACPDAPQPTSLRDYAPDQEAYDRALSQCSPTVLRVLTMEGDKGIQEPPPCTEDPFVCICPEHSEERLRAVRRGALGAGPAAFRVVKRAA